MVTANQTDRFKRKWMPVMLLSVAILLGAAAWILARYAVPLLLARTPPARITPTLLQTLNLRVWTAAFSAVFLAAGVLFRLLRLSWRPSWSVLAVVLTGVALLLRWVTPDMAFNSIVRPDGVHFSVTAQQLVSHGTLLVPTGSALLPPRTLPGPSFLQALTQWIRPDHPGYGIFAVWICAGLSLWFAFSFGRRFHGTAAGAWAVLLLALSPALGWYSRQLMSEIPWGLLILASCGLLATGIRCPGRAALAGGLAGLGLLIKSSHLLVLIGMVLGLAVAHFRKERIRAATWGAFLAGLAAGGLPAFLYNRLVLGGWLKTAYHVYWPGWASATTALNVQYLWSPPLINGSMGNVPYYLLALLGLDPRPERMILLPGVVLLLVYLLARRQRAQARDLPIEANVFRLLAIGAAGLYGIGCMLYSFQEPRFFLPVVPLAFVALAGPLARAGTGFPAGRRIAEAAFPVLLAGLLGLGAAILKVEAFSTRIPERQLLQQLADASAPYDVLISDEDPVLLTTFGVWTGQTRVWPMLLPGELWFPNDPAELFKEKGMAVEPFAGTVPCVTAALAEGRSVASYIRRPHTRPEAWQSFTNAFELIPLVRGNLSGFAEVRRRENADLPPAPPALPAEAAAIPSEKSAEAPPTVPGPAPVFLLGMEMEEDATARTRSLPPHPVTLDPFVLERAEVDQASYAAFLNDEWADGRLAPEINDTSLVILWKPGSEGGAWPVCSIRESDPQCGLRFDPAQPSPFYVATNAAADMNRHPMSRVSWPGAAAFCNWRSRAEGRSVSYAFPANPAEPIAFADRGGYRLPTEAEWEWTATWDGTRKHRYAWGDDWDPSQANLAESPRPLHGESEPFTLPVDQPPPWRTSDTANPATHLHLSGNVWEWCQDWFSDYTDAPAANPAGPDTGDIKIVRGGSFRTRRESAWAAFRGIAAPGTMTADIGFRLARSIH